MIDRVNVIPLTERQNEDEAQAAIIQIDEVLTLLQELGDVARRARMNLVAPGTGILVSPRLRYPPPEPPAPRHGPRANPPGSPLPRAAVPEPTRSSLPLTRRQKEVLNLLAQGLSNRRIGRALHITEQTVKAHLHMVYHKLGVADRTEAVVIALRQGLCSAPAQGGPAS